MKKIALSLLTIAAVAVMATGATGAYFTSEVTIPTETFSTGTLEITDNSAAYQKFSFTNLKPGDHVRKYVTLTNTGTLDVDYLTVNKENVLDDDGLLAQMPVSVSASISGVDGAFFTPNWTGGTTVGAFFNNSNVLDAPSFYRTPAGVIKPGQTYVVALDFSLPTTLGSEWQNKTASFDLVFSAEQSHESSFQF